MEQHQSQEPVITAQSHAAYAGFWRRVVAYLLDGIIVGALIYVFFGHGSVIPSIAIMWLYFALMESSKFQATLGKMALNLKVTDMSGHKIGFARATGRFFGKYLSSIILCIGYLMVIWTEKKQGLHDILAKTLVVKAK